MNKSALADARPVTGVELGASVINDLPETDNALLTEGQDYDYRTSVPGTASFVSVELAGISLES